jgi:uncharacterized protein YlbG (UPF0298 family)
MDKSKTKRVGIMVYADPFDPHVQIPQLEEYGKIRHVFENSSRYSLDSVDSDKVHEMEEFEWITKIEYVKKVRKS